MEKIHLKDDFIKLGQALKLAGLVDSGVEAKIVIQDGKVSVNGAAELQRGKKLYPGDVVSFGGKEFQIEKKILGIEEKTIQNYEQSIKRFMTGMKWDDIQLMELEQSNIMKFIANLQEQELSTETINHYLRDLRAFFNWCSRIHGKN